MATHARTAVLADIAKTMRGKMRVARVVGKDLGLMVKEYDTTRLVFLESHNWPPHPDIRDQLALQLEGRGFVETNIEKAGQEAVINTENEQVQWRSVSHYEVLEKCQTAKEGDHVVFGDATKFDVSSLRWILKKSSKDFSVFREGREGVFMATIPGLFGDYRILSKGYWDIPRNGSGVPGGGDRTSSR